VTTEKAEKGCGTFDDLQKLLPAATSSTLEKLSRLAQQNFFAKLRRDDTG
jgi:hypothetical protein